MPALFTHGQRAYETIKERISTHQLRPGTKLVEEQMAEEIGISRTPVREALNRLEKDGLVKIFPNWGSYVKKMDFEEIREIYDLREALEGMAARIAAFLISEEEIEKLKRLCGGCNHFGKIGNFESRLKNDMEFHELLVRASQNKRLQEIMTLFNIQIRSFRISNTLWPPGKRTPVPENTKEHLKIIKALTEHNPDLAEKAAREHIRKAKERLEKRE
jgi:DNA-binding GntR family transcriptional regulator